MFLHFHTAPNVAFSVGVSSPVLVACSGYHEYPWSEAMIKEDILMLCGNDVDLILRQVRLELHSTSSTPQDTRGTPASGCNSLAERVDLGFSDYEDSS